MVTFYAVLRCFDPCNFNIVHALHNIIIIAIYASLPTLPFVDSFTNITEVNYSFETNLLIHIWVENSVVKIGALHYAGERWSNRVRGG